MQKQIITGIQFHHISLPRNYKLWFSYFPYKQDDAFKRAPVWDWHSESLKKRMDSLILFKQTRKRKKSSNIYSWVNAYQLQNVLILWHHTEFQWGIAVGGEGVGGAREKEIECERKRERERVFRHIKLVKSYIYNHHYRWRSIYSMLNI